MPFRELYEYAQTVTPRIRREQLEEKVLQLSGINRIAVVRSGLDITQCRGMYLSLEETDHHFIRQNGCRVIVLARDLDKPWSRVVHAKELMHLFDDAGSAADTGEKFETLLTELTGGASVDLSPATRSEIKCFWMALSVLCPENHRQKLLAARKQGEIDHATIAVQLRIPELYVEHLLSPIFDRNRDRLLRGEL